MVLRFGGWPITASVAACIAATGASVAWGEDIDTSIVTGSTKYVWGGPVPALAKPGEKVVYVPSVGLNGAAPEPQVQDFVQAPYAVEVEPPKPRAPVIVAPGESVEEGEGRESAEADDAPDAPDVPESTLASKVPDAPPALLAPPSRADAADTAAAYAPPTADPWDGLKTVTPGREMKPRKPAKSLPAYASLEPQGGARSRVDDADGVSGRGALEEETPTGYANLPRGEMQCRKALSRLGVRFVDVSTIRRGRSCGIDFPVKVAEISPGVAMKPAAVLNCMTALRVSQWVRNEVAPAAAESLSKRPAALFNASSYRCSRIAGSRTISEHASGNALDVAGFQLADGSRSAVRKKGAFEFSEKSFQKRVRQSACRYFGTVLGPGYNRDHADHLHLDLKQRRRGVCK